MAAAQKQPQVSSTEFRQERATVNGESTSDSIKEKLKHNGEDNDNIRRNEKSSLEENGDYLAECHEESPSTTNANGSFSSTTPKEPFSINSEGLKEGKVSSREEDLESTGFVVSVNDELQSESEVLENLNGEAKTAPGPEVENSQASELDNSKTEFENQFPEKVDEQSDKNSGGTPPEDNTLSSCTPPGSRGSPSLLTERGRHSGGNHKFLDEESKAEYMKIKSEVTGEGQTSESENEEDETFEAGEPKVHHGSHSSPDAETKAEYRKIKFEVTGEGETSESEDESLPGLEEDIRSTKTTDNAANTENIKETDRKDEWTDLLGNGLLKKRVLRTGKGRDTRPDRGQIVMLRIAGRLEDGTGVDWNQCMQFILGDGEVIQALDLGVALMEVEEVCEVVTDARYAYGEQGRKECTPPVPPNAKITYEIELMAVRDGPDIETIDEDERIKIGDKKRELGNELYVRGDFSAAINCYQRAIKYLMPSSAEKVQEVKVKCWNNMAAAQLKVKAYNAALTSCMQVLQVDPDNVKALFRKGKVLAAQGEIEQAIVFVKKANQLDPSNKTIRSELTNLRRHLTAQNQKERNMYQRMVGGLIGKEHSTKTSGILSWSLVIGATVIALGGMLAAIYIGRH